MIERSFTLIFLFSAFLANAQSEEYSFSHLSTDVGLSNHQVNSIRQDELGFIWVGTLSGLNRYDGYEVTPFYHEPGNPNSLLNNAIIWMEQGPDHCMWFNTGMGFTLYDMKQERFKSADTYLDSLKIAAGEIVGLMVDSEGNTWFRTNRDGLIQLDKTTGRYSRINTSERGFFRIATNTVTDLANGSDKNVWIIHGTAMVEVIDVQMNKIIRKFDLKRHMDFKTEFFKLFLDRENNIWAYSFENPFGVFYLNTTTGEFKLYDEKQLHGRIVRSLIQRPNGDIWIGVDHGGISILKKETGSLVHLVADPNNPNSLGSNNVNNLFQDKDGIVWIGTSKNGISYHTERSGSFPKFQYKHPDPSYNDITSLTEDEDGTIWIGSDGRGLLQFDRQSKTIKPVYARKTGAESPKVIVSQLLASDGYLWIGTYLEGLYRYKDGIFTEVPLEEITKVAITNVWQLFEDRQQNIWIGTLSNGIFQLSKDGSVTQYNQDSGMYSNYITCAEEDSRGNVWVGCGSGISVIDPRAKSIRNYHSADSGPTISNNSVTSLLRDREDKIWIGTMSGLNIYDPTTETFKVYYKKDGLASDIVMAVLEDDAGNKWISSNQGITKIETIEDSTYFKTYETVDGLQGDIFNEGAALKTRDGMLLFAGQNGFNMFDPARVEYEHTPPKLVFTDFFISNNRINPGQKYGGRVILPLGLNSAGEVLLEHDENSFAIGFTSPTFFQPTKIRYQYKLEGFDKGWINLQSETKRVNYTNLDFGTYTFRVRASSNHQVWTDETIDLRIKILPPFWQTPWANILYVIALVTALYFIRRAIIQRERRKAKIKQDKLEEERLHELDLMKIKFFTNISHEFRTPISLIMTPVERMIEDPTTAKVSDYKMVFRNAKRLLNLVNQLLDFRKMEVNQHVLSESSGDLVRFMQDIADSFTDISRDREVELRFETDLKSYLTRFDKDKMEKIFFNLLSNAFKFTLPGGSIILSMEHIKREGTPSDWITIYVTDTGIGIPQDKQDAIFNRFFQTQIPSNIINNGSGIGLAITKEFVELHKGRVTVESQENIGSTFIVELPLKDISKDQAHAAGPEEDELEAFVSEIDPSKPTVFLVEDNSDFRFYLRDNMRQWYNVLEASNGKDGWKGIMKVVPDIVISDVMMPVMDGLELCRKIKNDPRTSHIPVILLTAQSSDHHRIEGLDAGAIEYISKPFNFEILISNIKSALKFQNRIIEANKKVVVTPSEVSIVSMDEQLIIKATKLVEDNMSNSEFSVEDMSHDLGYSRGHLYQKMLKITGQTPMDFIRNIRMSRAEELLKKSQMNVSEIAYKVGYNNPKLFSRYFKYHFNKYPSEFLSEARKANGKTDPVG